MVFSYSSTPVYLLLFHSPFFSDALASGMWRDSAISWPIANSAAEITFEVGAFTTITPAFVAALMSTLSRPTPARAMTLSFGAAAIASSSILVAERIKTALASFRAASSWERSAPSTFRTSKSGPSASTVAGESSSAIRTTGLDNGKPNVVIDSDGNA